MDSHIKKVAMVLICTGYKYWEYIGPMVESARKHFLKNQKVDYFLWSDIPEDVNYGCSVFETEATDWPYPTLMRYHLFLQQEELLQEYDYIFYCDADMLFVDDVGNEILGDGLTATEHPMYALRREFKYPFEPNPESKAFVKIPQHYFAGGFQGGKTEDFIKAMWSMKRSINADFDISYRARWNDESHWNKYLFDHPPAVILDPSYCYPNSMVKSYYEPIWGTSYKPKLMTIDKKFSFTKSGGEHAKKLQNELKVLQ